MDADFGIKVGTSVFVLVFGSKGQMAFLWVNKGQIANGEFPGHSRQFVRRRHPFDKQIVPKMQAHLAKRRNGRERGRRQGVRGCVPDPGHHVPDDLDQGGGPGIGTAATLNRLSLFGNRREREMKIEIRVVGAPSPIPISTAEFAGEFYSQLDR
ncbi:hypothetical protein CRG98_039848 [Punica granatum]|uniref:Uncharacterized protein n=1 Tax=Punica granatum TaxID=22663 RepID=A0A2I0I7N7_PUNGR|nr:hypothetical protein CRG98_039848 [Punica granatum]